jgi:transcriptional regulator with XRE-family HTH domain
MDTRKDSDLSIAVCLALKSLFRNSRKTLKIVSLETGVTVSSLSRIHNFGSIPSIVDVILLCNSYKISLQEFSDFVEKIKLDSSMLENVRNLQVLTKELRIKFHSTATQNP